MSHSPIIPLLALLLTASVSAADIAYEPFAAYNLDQSLPNSAQPDPPATTGIADYNAGNVGLTWSPRDGSLSYSSPFETSGAKLQVASGGVAMTAPLDLTGGNWTPYNNGSGSVGTTNGTRLYFSLLFQVLDPSDRTNNQRLWALQESGAGRFTVGQGWSSSTFTAGNNLGIPLDADVHLVVVRVDYRSGNDSVRVYWDPDPSLPEPASATSTQSRNMAFNEIMYKGQRASAGGFHVDEIRFGSTWETVTPVPVTTSALTLSAGAGGTVYADPTKTTFNLDETVYIEAASDWGFRFDHWSGDVPAGSENDSRLTLTMDQSRTISAVFQPGKADFFNHDPAPDTYAASPVDLRPLNEPVAGASGWVTRSGDDFVLGDGNRTRFWAATVSPIADPNLSEMARFLSKRGVNMVRWHTSIYNNNAASLSSVQPNKIDDLQRMVTRMKAEGIYTKASFFFVLGLRMQAEWGIDGYDASWIAANPGQAPFGIIFFDEDFKAAYKSWANALFSTPNPYNSNIPLKDDPALAIIETQNEDNLFFWTFKPSTYPVAQQQKLDGLFATFLTGKYGSLTTAQNTWGSVSSSLKGRDNPGTGRLTVNDAWFMTSGFSGSAGDRNRMHDQVQFLTKLQRDWYTEMVDYMKNTVGCNQLFTASNWTTAENALLLDAEYYTYTAADITDSHNYFSPAVNDKALFTLVSGGDDFFGIPAVNNPRALPLALKQAEGHPSMISESTWVNPSNFKAEAALMTAAYGSLGDIDSFFWFASNQPGWQSGLRTWEFATPMVAGMFPGAALLYRRGDVTEAPVVVREGRAPSSFGNRQPSLLVETRGWDATRDPGQEFDYDPNSGAGSLDSLASLVGKTEIAFDGETDTVHPDLDSFIDLDNRSVRSITGELELNWGQIQGANPAAPLEGQGRFTVNAPRAQAASGWMADAGTVNLDNVDITMHNEWGSVLVIALDHAPLTHASQILIQAATTERKRRWETIPKILTAGSTSYLGEEITSTGDLPWQIEGIDATVHLKGLGTITAVQALDANGHLIASLPPTTPITLPSQALYTVVTLTPPLTSTYGTWPRFTPLEHSDPSVGTGTANPDNDPWDNHTEYIFNTDPTVPDNLPIAISASTHVEFDIRTDDPTITHTVQLSADLNTWNHNGDPTGLTYTETISATPNGDGTTHFTVRLLNPATANFVRIAWTTP